MSGIVTEDFLKALPAEEPGLPEMPGLAPREPSISVRTVPTKAPATFTSRDLLRLAFKHKWRIFLPLVLFTSLGATYTLLASPWYQATATIKIEPNELGALTPAGDGILRARSFLSDQVQLLRSDSMLEQVVDALSLPSRMASLFPEDMPPADRVTGAIKILRENILSIQPVIDTNFIVVTATIGDPEWAFRIPNTLAEKYVEYVRERIADKATILSERYDEEARKTQRDLDLVKQRINEFLTEKGIPDMAQRFTSLRNRADRAAQELRDAERERIFSLKKIEALEAELKKEPATISSTTQVAANPQYQLISQYLNELQLRKTGMAGKWQPDSQQMRQLDAQIKEAEESLKTIDPETVAAKISQSNPRHEEILNELVSLRPLLAATEDEIEHLTKTVEEVEGQLAEFAQIRKTYLELLTEENRITQQLEFAKQRAQQAQTTGEFANEIAEVRISDPARRPLGPAGPNHVLNLFLAVFFGLGVGVGLVALKEVFRHGVETAEDVQKQLGLPVLGVIPDKAFW
ncbi:MAG: hypothetical protein GHCLOJNM_01646 [bacterium]|nr:hypothetical protein [bacterium]